MQWRRMVKVLVAVVCAAPLTVLASAHIGQAEEDHGPFRFTGTFTYTIDPAAGIVHASLATDIQGVGRSELHFQCLRSYFITIPASATNIVNTGYSYTDSWEPFSAQVLETRARAIEGTSTYKSLEVKMKTCMAADPRQHSYTELTYDFTTGSLRSQDPARINPSYIGFNAIGIGYPSGVTIEVVLPEAFEVDHLDDRWTAWTQGGVTTYSLAPADQVNLSDTYIGARNDSALVDIPVQSVAGQPFTVRHWPNDTEWGQLVAGAVEHGVPALSEAIGFAWPIEGETVIREAFSNSLDGSPGSFSPEATTITVSENVDQQLILHQLSYAWFNDDWFTERWLNEGFAQAYAAIATRDLGDIPTEPPAVTTETPGALPLSMWSDPFFGIEDTIETELYGYTASYYVIDTLMDDIGGDKMREILRRVDSGATAYAGDSEAEIWNDQIGWKQFLDMLEMVGGSTKAGQIFDDLVVGPASDEILHERKKARDAYDELDARGAPWAPPVGARHSMNDWDFDAFAEFAAAAHTTLDLRDQLADRCEQLDIPMPGDAEAAYEAAGDIDDLVAVQELIRSYIAAAQAVIDAAAAHGASPDFFSSIGLVGSDAHGELTAAREAFANGDPQGSIDHARKVTATIKDAHGQGVVRVWWTALLVLIVPLTVTLVWRLRRRRRRVDRPTQTAEVAAEPEVADQSADIADATVAADAEPTDQD